QRLTFNCRGNAALNQASRNDWLPCAFHFIQEALDHEIRRRPGGAFAPDGPSISHAPFFDSSIPFLRGFFACGWASQGSWASQQIDILLVKLFLVEVFLDRKSVV